MSRHFYDGFVDKKAPFSIRMMGLVVMGIMGIFIFMVIMPMVDKVSIADKYGNIRLNSLHHRLIYHKKNDI